MCRCQRNSAYPSVLTPLTVFGARVHNLFKNCEIVTPNAWASISRVGKQTFFFPRSMSEM